jgi:hypothetical protein
MVLIFQRGLRRGKVANRVGLALLFGLLAILLASILKGVSSLSVC